MERGNAGGGRGWAYTIDKLETFGRKAGFRQSAAERRDRTA